jgi:Phage phiEco32-like COOH.NH2 ligase-type 2
MNAKAAARNKPTEVELVPMEDSPTVFPRIIPHTDIRLFDTITFQGNDNYTVLCVAPSGKFTVAANSIYRAYATLPDLVLLISRPNEEERKKLADSYGVSKIVKGAYNGIASVGSDPEIFVEDEDGKVVPAFTFLDDKEKVGVEVPYWDGFQAEFSTEPSHCIAYLADSTQKALSSLHEKVKVAGKGKWRLTDRSVVDVDQEFLQQIDPKFSQFGCTPSLNAYGDQGPMMDGAYVPFRMAGGHIHIGARLSGVDVNHVVKQMDKIVGVMSVALFCGMEDPRRRFLYGRAGEYRLPPHGLEYRVLSNAWLCHPVIMNFITHVARISAAIGMWGFNPTDITDEEAQEAINDSNSDMALALMERNKKFFDLVMGAVVHKSYIATRKLLDAAIREGVASYLPEAGLDKRWRMYGQWIRHCGAQGTAINNSNSIIEQTGKLG